MVVDDRCCHREYCTNNQRHQQPGVQICAVVAEEALQCFFAIMSMCVENHCATGSMPCDDATVLVDSNSTVCPGDRAEPGWTTVVAKAKTKNMQRPPRRQGST